MRKQKIHLLAFLFILGIALASCSSSHPRGCGCPSFSQIENTTQEQAQ